MMEMYKLTHINLKPICGVYMKCGELLKHVEKQVIKQTPREEKSP